MGQRLITGPFSGPNFGSESTIAFDQRVHEIGLTVIFLSAAGIPNGPLRYHLRIALRSGGGSSTTHNIFGMTYSGSRYDYLQRRH